MKTTIVPMKFGEWKPDKALGPIRDMATANPDLKIMYSMSDVMQGGIIQGLKEAGLWNKGILMGSYDGGMNAIKEMLDNPKGPLQADASNQPWDQAVLAVKMALAGYNKDANACPVEDELRADGRRDARHRQAILQGRRDLRPLRRLAASPVCVAPARARTGCARSARPSIGRHGGSDGTSRCGGPFGRPHLLQRLRSAHRRSDRGAHHSWRGRRHRRDRRGRRLLHRSRRRRLQHLLCRRSTAWA